MLDSELTIEIKIAGPLAIEMKNVLTKTEIQEAGVAGGKLVSYLLIEKFKKVGGVRDRDMDITDTLFSDWYETLQMRLSEAGVDYNEKDEARQDYDSGKSVFDAVDEIRAGLELEG